METKKSKVSKILHNVRMWNSSKGPIYYHKITFDNGDSGEYGSKTEACQKFTEGQEASYTIETKVNGQYTNVIVRPAQEFVPNPQGFKKQSGSDESFSLSYAKDVTVALIEKGSLETTTQTIARAEEFYKWLQSKKN